MQRIAARRTWPYCRKWCQYRCTLPASAKGLVARRLHPACFLSAGAKARHARIQVRSHRHGLEQRTGPKRRRKAAAAPPMRPARSPPFRGHWPAQSKPRKCCPVASRSLGEAVGQCSEREHAHCPRCGGGAAVMSTRRSLRHFFGACCSLWRESDTASAHAWFHRLRARKPIPPRFSTVDASLGLVLLRRTRRLRPGPFHHRERLERRPIRIKTIQQLRLVSNPDER